MFARHCNQCGVSLNRFNGRTQLLYLLGLCTDFLAQPIDIFFLLLCFGLVVGRISALDALKCLLLFFKRFLRLGQFASGAMKVHQSPHQLIQPAQLHHRIGFVFAALNKVLVAVDNHAELCTPVTQMIISNNFVAEKPMNVGQRITDDGRANVTNVHRLGDIGRRIIHYHRTW